MNRFPILLLFIFTILFSNAQSIDKIEVVIGDEIILTSEIQNQYLQYLSERIDTFAISKCDIIEEIMFQKLLINQSKMDSIEVTSDEVDSEVDKRISYFEKQLGSIVKVEEYFQKGIVDIQDELKKVIKSQIQAQRMQSEITKYVKVTPAEVKDFFTSLDINNIPIIPTQVEIQQIVVKPLVSQEQKEKIRSKLNQFRQRVYSGEDFKVLAALYSDDLGSANKGGELGFVNRGDLEPVFERVAFRLKEGEISEVVESQYGMHIIQLIERRGDQINVRHILIKAKANSEANRNAQLEAQRISSEINSGIISFSDAIIKYSNDESKNNGGLLLNPNNMSTMHTFDDMSISLRLKIKDMKVGEITSPAIIQIQNENSGYRILKLNKRIEEHRANIVEDFTIIKNLALNVKKQEVLLLWINDKINETFIHLSENVLNCEFKNNWIK